MASEPLQYLTRVAGRNGWKLDYRAANVYTLSSGDVTVSFYDGADPYPMIQTAFKPIVILTKDDAVRLVEAFRTQLELRAQG